MVGGHCWLQGQYSQANVVLVLDLWFVTPASSWGSVTYFKNAFPLRDSCGKTRHAYPLHLYHSSNPETRLFPKANSNTIEHVGMHILIPSPGTRQGELPHNFWVLISYDFVQIDDIIMTIHHSIAIGITGVNRARISYAVEDAQSKLLVVDITQL